MMKPSEDVRAEIAAAVASALSARPEIGYKHSRFHIEVDDANDLILEGEVDTVAAKKLALECAAAAARDVGAIVDRVRVAPAVAMSDGDIRSHVRDAFLEERSFADFTIAVRVGDEITLARDQGEAARGRLEVEVREGVVILNGEVPGLVDKRLAGVLAWWVPGARDVVNGLVVEPPEEDGPDQIEEAVRVVLEKNRFVDASQIRVGVRDRVVRLTGLLPTEEQRRMAEADAWCVFGVDAVVNEIEVKPD